jgi:hypothetical protein
VRACLIVHALVSHVEDSIYEADFWEWIDEGMEGQEGNEDDDPVYHFAWNGALEPLPGENAGQTKCRLVQEALFTAIY